MRKPAFCICENKDADQLRGDREADQRLCFRYIDSTIPLLSKSEISSLYSSSLAVQPGLCRTRSETRTLVFSRRGSNHKTRKNIDSYNHLLWFARGLYMTTATLLNGHLFIGDLKILLFNAYQGHYFGLPPLFSIASIKKLNIASFQAPRYTK